MSAEIRRPPYAFAIVLCLLSLPYLYGGIRLAAVGGSYYYALAGATLAVCGVLVWKRNRLASYVYGLLVATTFIWALWEVGANAWALMPRVLMLALIGLWFLTPFFRRRIFAPQPPPPLLGTALTNGLAAVVAVAVAYVATASFRTDVQAMPERFAAKAAAAIAEPESVSEWHSYGNTNHGTRFARLDQITPKNVGKLEKLWEVRTNQKGWFKATPTQAGDLLYICTAFNVVQALDADTGALRWQFDPQSKAGNRGFTQNCRGVTYYKAPAEYTGACRERIIMGTTDARLFALDAKTGERCAGFGENGEIS